MKVKFCIAWMVGFISLAIALMFVNAQTLKAFFEVSLGLMLILGFVNERRFKFFEWKIKTELKKLMKL